jgi:hypothetical protein
MSFDPSSTKLVGQEGWLASHKTRCFWEVLGYRHLLVTRGSAGAEKKTDATVDLWMH